MRPPPRLSAIARIALATVLAVPVVLLARPPEPADAATRNFTLRYAVNTSGFTRLRGNTVLECNAAVSSTCPTAVSAPIGNTASNAAFNNNNNSQRWVDVDTDATTFNSSSSEVSWEPAAGASIRWAGLYWGGDSDNTGTVDDPPNVAQRNRVLLAAPGQAYQTVTDPDGVDTIPSTSDTVFQGFADVTSVLRAGGPGNYTVANVQAAKGFNAVGGWALVVVVEDPREPSRNMAVYDGFTEVSGPNVNIGVSGFQTPPAGTVRTRVGTVAYEGDRGSVGDQLLLNGTALTDTSNPATNYFNSSISDGLTPVVRNPNASNTLGLDIDRIQTTLPNGATNATITLRTSGDFYYPGVVSFETELYSPKLDVTKSFTDLNGGVVEPGDTLQYTVSLRNSGQDIANQVVLTDPLPAEVTYVPGSIAVNGTARTDAAGDDQADRSGSTISVRLGTGATASAGGSMAVGASQTVTFRATVNAGLADQTPIVNTANVSYVGAQTGLPLSAAGPVTATVVNPLADVSVTKAGGPFTAGGEGFYTITASNAGPQPADAPVRVVDTLPAGVDFGGASGPGWTCTFSASTRQVTCVLGTALAPGTSAGPISLRVGVDPARAAGTVTNGVTVTSGTEDPNLTNNSQNQVASVVRSADLVVSKANLEPVFIGVNEDVEIDVLNFGPSTAEGPVTVVDTLPPGFSFLSATGVGWSCSASGSTVTCTRAAGLAVAEAAPPLVLTLDTANALPPSVTNQVTATSATPDPTPARASDPMTIVRAVDLGIEKSHTGVISTTNPFRIRVTSNGVASIPAGTVLTVVDTLPAGVTLLSATGTGWVCDPPSGGQFRCRYTLPAPLLAGSSLPDLQVRVDPGSGGAATLENVAALDLAGAPFTDPLLANNTARDTFATPASADLGITKAVQGPVVAGRPVTFALTVTNNGPDAAAGPITVTDFHGVRFRFLAAGQPGSQTDPTCASAGSATAICTLAGPLALNASRIVLLTGILDSAAPPGQANNTAQVNGPTPDPVPANDSLTVPYTVTTSADLSVTKTGPASASPGETIEYVVTITNAGPSVADGPVQLVDILPDNTRFISSSSSDPWVCVGVSEVNCTLTSPVVPGTPTILRLRVFLDPALTSLKGNTVTVSSPTPDPGGPANNENNPAVVPLEPRADLSVSKSDRGETAVPGSTFTYDVTLSNAGPATAAGPTAIVDTLPPGVTFVSASGGRSCSVSGQQVTCTNPEPLGPGVSRTFGLTVLLDPGINAPIPNRLDASSPTFDPNLANNGFDLRTPVQVIADIRMDKTARGLFPAGGVGLYTLDVDNAGPSTNPGQLTVTDPLPDGLTLSSATGAGWTCSAVGQLVTCTRPGPVPVGPVPRIDLRVNVAPTLVGSVINGAQVDAPGTDPLPNNNADVSSGVIQRQADLSIVKTHAPEPVVAGTSGTATVTVTNNGPAALTEGDVVTVTDVFPAPLTPGALASPSWSCAGWPTATCTLTLAGPVAVGGSLPPLPIGFGVPASAAPGTVTNTATVASSVSDTVSANNQTTDPIAIAASAALQVTKASGGPGVAGSPVTFTVSVANPTGPSVAAGPITVTDQLAPGLTFVSASASWACSATGPTLTCTNPSSIPVGGTAPPLVVTVTTASTLVTSVPNTARATSATPDPGTAEGSTTLPLTTSADLSITKTASSPVVAGGLVTYTLTAKNAGPSTAAGVTVTDVLPAGLSFVSADPAACTYAAPTRTVSCDLGAVAPGPLPAISLVARVSDAAAGTSIANTGVVASLTPDPVAANDAATVAVSPVPETDLAVTKTHEPTNFLGGTTGTFVVKTLNLGPSVLGAGKAVSITDTLPAGLTYTAVVGSDWACSPVGQVVTCGLTTAAPVAVGATLRELRFTVDIAADLVGPVVNTVTVAGPNDPTATNDTATDDVSVDTRADLDLAKSGPATALGGTELIWTLTLENLGPSLARDVVVTDVLPSGVTFVSVSPTGACSYDDPTRTVTCTRSTLSTGPVVEATITVGVDEAFTGPLANTATAASSVTDPVPGNDTATATTTVTPAADLAIQKEAFGFLAGTPGSYRITVSNAGPSVAAAPVVVDTLPAGMTVRSVTAPGATCTGTTELRCTGTGPLVVGGTSVVDVVVDVAPGMAPGQVTNTATVTSTTPDPGLLPNSAEVTATVAAAAGLTVTKAGPATATPGGAISWSVDVGNTGPSTAAGPITVTDTVPAGTSDPVGSGTDWTCPSPVAATVTCTHPGPVPPGGTLPALTISASIEPAATGSLRNTATVTSATPGGPVTSFPAVSVLAPSADLRLTKASPGGPFVPGTSATYELTVTNDGPSDTPGPIVVTDTFPGGISGTTGGDDGWTCSVSGPAATCTRAAGLTVGASATFSIGVNVSPDLTDPVTNTATVDGPAPDPTPGNDTGGVTTPVSPFSALAVTKTGPATVVAGTVATYQVVVANNGPSRAGTPVVVTDTLPAGLTYSAAGGAGWSCGFAGSTVSCTWDTTLPVGLGTGPLTITANADPALAPGTILTNTADANSPTDPDGASGSFDSAVVLEADLGITKVHDPAVFVVGEPARYDVTVVNNGPSVLPSGSTLRVLDTLPAGQTLDGPTAPWVCSGTSTVSCELALGAPLTAGSSVSLSLPAAVTSLAGGSNVVTTGETTDPGGQLVADPVEANNTAGDNASVVDEADLTITKTSDPSTFVAGTTGTFTIAVTNDGPSPARGPIVVTDLLPPGFTSTGSQPTGWTCDPLPGDPPITCTSTTVSDTSPLAVGASVSLVLPVKVTSNLAPGTSDNRATVASATTDPGVGNSTTELPVTVTTKADLAIVAVPSAPATPAGTSFDHVVTVTNNGPSDAAGPLTVTTTLPPGTSVLGWIGGDCVATGPLLVCTLPGPSLAAGASAELTVQVGTSPSAGGQKVSTTFQVGSATADPDVTNNSGADDVLLTAVADLSIAKVVVTPASEIVAGRTVTFALTLTNAGPSDASTVAVTDVLPAGLTLAVSGTSPACTPGDGAVQCTSGVVPAGASRTFTLVADIDPAAVGPRLNEASLGLPPGVVDPDVDDHTSGPVPFEILQVADLRVTAAATGPAVAGETATVVVTLASGGPSVARDPTVVLAIPAGPTAATATGDGWSCTPATATITCTRSDGLPLAPGASFPPITLVLDLPSSQAAGAPAFTVLASATSAATDPTPGDATDVPAPVTVETSANLGVTKVGPAVLVAGTSATYTVTVTNAGPSDAAAVVVDDTLPLGLAAGAGTDPRCAPAGAVLRCTLGTMTPSDQIALTVVVPVPGAQGPGQAVNSVTVASPTPDPDRADNTASVSAPVAQQADVSVTKSVATPPAQIVAGTVVAFEVTVSNAGPTSVTGLTVTDALPSGLTLEAAGTSPACVADGTAVVCTSGLLAATRSETFTIVASIDPAAGGQLANSATVVVPDGVVDPDPDDNTTGPVPFVVLQEADLSVTASARGPVVAGRSVTLDIAVANAGPSVAPAISLVLDVPAGVTVRSASGTGWTCTPVAGTVTCLRTDGVAIAPGAPVPPIALVLDVPSSWPAGDPSFSVVASATSNATDPTPDDAVGIVAPVEVTTSADLAVLKQGPAVLVAGTSATYTVTVTNAGPSDATAVVVDDTLPLGLAAGAGTDPRCAPAGAVLRCTLGTMTPGDEIALTVAVPVPVGTTATSATNTATVSSDTPDPTEENNTAEVSAPVTQQADVGVTLAGPAGPVVAGSAAAIAVAAVNNGPSAAPRTTVVLTLPAGFTLDPSTSAPCTSAGATVTCSLGSLQPGATSRFTLSLLTPPGAPDQTVTVSATVASGVSDPTPGNNSATASVVVQARTVTLQATPACSQNSPVVQYQVSANFPFETATLSFAGTDGTVRVQVPGVAPSGTVLWPGATRGADGQGTDWPGWIETSPGVWRPGDDGFLWARPQLLVTATVNPTSAAVALRYPPSSPSCLTDPPNTLPPTGADPRQHVTMALLLLASGAALLSLRRRPRTR